MRGLASVEEWGRFLARVGAVVLGVAIPLQLAQWIADATCPTCSWQWGVTILGAIWIGVPLVAFPLVVIFCCVVLIRQRRTAHRLRARLMGEEFREG